MTETDNFKIVNLEQVRRGDTFRKQTFELGYTDTDEAIDLTGCEIRAMFRLGSETGQKYLDLSVGDGITVDDAEAGEFSFDEINKLSIPAGTYFYDVEITFTTGERYTWFGGTMVVSRDVTY
jgi:hypothetical protein